MNGDAMLQREVSRKVSSMALTFKSVIQGNIRAQVALDELGRGTSTSDGAAIAGAVLDHLTSTVGCRSGPALPDPRPPCSASGP